MTRTSRGANVHILRIEHRISDFGTWKAAFDHFSGWRERSGVRRHRILRPTDDPSYVMIDLEFGGASEADAFLAALRRDVWPSREAAPALIGNPQARVVEAVEAIGY